MISVAADCTFPGDIVVAGDWQLHVTGSGIDDQGRPFFTSREMGDMQLHLAPALTVDPRPIEAKS